MNKNILPLTALALVLGAAPLFAQTNAPTERNRFGLSYRFGLNLSARFKNAGITPAASPGAALGGIDHNYNDGYVRVDYSGNYGGETWNWNYNHAAQVHGQSVVLSASNPGDLGGKTDGDPQHGLELTFNRELGHLGRCPWGVEAAFGFTDLTFRQSATVTGGPLTVDAYAMSPEAGPVPLPPQGTFAGPGPMLSDTPARLPVTVASELTGAMYGFRVGPYLDIPLGERVTFTLSAGLAVAVLDTEFSYQQTYTAPDAAAVSQARTGTHSDVLPGGFVAGNLSCRLGKGWTVFAGAQYQNTGTYTHTLADKQAQVDLRQGIFVTAGVGWAF